MSSTFANAGAARSGPASRSDPSGAAKRVVVAVGAMVGCALAVRLTIYQLGQSSPPWEPIFGNGTVRVLTSSLSRALPIPDASLGAVAYLAEIAAVAVGGASRWRDWPMAVYVYAAIALGMAAFSAALIALQLFVIHSFCTLCLASALLSFALAVPAATELSATWKARRLR